jgi:hypothetical protein
MALSVVSHLHVYRTAQPSPVCVACSVLHKSTHSIVPFCYPVSMPSSSSQPFCQMLTLSLCLSARHTFPVLQQKRQIHRHLSLDSRLLCVIVSSYVSYPSIFTIRILPFCSFFSFLPLWTHPLMISCPINHSPYTPTILFFYLKIIYQFHLFFPCLVFALSNLCDTLHTSVHINYVRPWNTSTAKYLLYMYSTSYWYVLWCILGICAGSASFCSAIRCRMSIQWTNVVTDFWMMTIQVN